MPFPNNIDLRLGPLGPLIADAITETGESPSEWVRDAIAKKLGVEPPEMRGNLATLKQFAKPKKKSLRRAKRRK